MEDNNNTINININTILDTLSNDMFIDFSHISNYEQVSEKEKLITRITKNINVIRNLYVNNIICDKNVINNIFSSLKELRIIDNKNNSLMHYKKIRKILGYIIYDIYRFSNYHVLMSNIPIKTLIFNNIDDIDDFELITSEIIYDTIQKYIGINTIDNVFQVSDNNYLIKMINIFDSIKLCNSLNKMQIGSNIIKVELLNPIPILVEPVIIKKVSVEQVVIESVQSDDSIVSDSIVSDIITSNIDLDKEDDEEEDDKEEDKEEEDDKQEEDKEEEDDKQEEEDDENIVYISKEFSKNQSLYKKLESNMDDMSNIDDKIVLEEINQTPTSLKSSLVSDIAYGIYNKVSNVFSFFRRS